MFSHAVLCLVLGLDRLVAPVSALWPIPQHYSNGNTVLFLGPSVDITYNGISVPFVPGYQPPGLTATDVIMGGIARTLHSIFSANFVPWMLHARNASFEPDAHAPMTWIKSLEMTQTTPDPSTIKTTATKATTTTTTTMYRPGSGDTDESYNLTLSATGQAKLSASTAVGLLRGLETFSQLFYQHSNGTLWYTPYAPVAIRDAPMFAHRGLLLDVARSWYPMSTLFRVIDGLAYNKMNKFHVHATDSQAWPLVIESMPELAHKGAYRPDYTYSPDDVQALQVYGAQRGVDVFFEMDMPGHIASVAWSHPELIAAFDATPWIYWCAEPPCGAFKLNNSAVDDFVAHVLDDLLPRLVPYTAYFHTGGDELNANDSALDPAIGTNASAVLQPLVQTFIDKVHSRVRAHGLTPMTWEEIPLAWNVTMGKDAVVQTWRGASSVKTLTATGHKVIDSNYNYWYLDCGRGDWLSFANGPVYQKSWPFTDWCGPTKAWQLIYAHDPTAQLTVDEARYVLGGEVALWSEMADAVNVDTLLWPRSSAAAEVLWSGRVDAAGQNRSLLDATPRLNELRARLVARGIGAAPVQMTYCSQASPEVCSLPVM